MNRVQHAVGFLRDFDACINQFQTHALLPKKCPGQKAEASSRLLGGGGGGGVGPQGSISFFLLAILAQVCPIKPWAGFFAWHSSARRLLNGNSKLRADRFRAAAHHV